MEWWEYLIVLGVWVIISVAVWAAQTSEEDESWERTWLKGIFGFVVFCFLLLLLITYKLFIDPIW